MEIYPSFMHTRRMRAARTILYTILVVVLVDLRAAAARELSGRELLQLCGSSQDKANDASACVEYFEHVLSGFTGQSGRPPALHFCLPQGTLTGDLIELYRSESKIFPQVLNVSASRLIIGMVLKFFPCQAV